MPQFAGMSIAELKDYLKTFEILPPEVEKELAEDRRKGVQELLTRKKKAEVARTVELKRLEKMLLWEKKLWKNGFQLVAGIDEAGRGPLAGPVVAAAVVLPRDVCITGLNDSKKLTPIKRNQLYEEIIINALAYGLGSAENREIDRLNIHQATFLAMKRAIARLHTAPEFVLVDGFKIPGLAQPQEAICGGDGLSLSIAAASVLAKVTRDKIMCNLDGLYPQYGFKKHMGYGTEEHRIALNRYGPCAAHRASFKLDY